MNNNRRDNSIAKPFLKWAGGKNQLLDDISSRYPLDIGKKITRYCEPFIGGGAVLFDILAKHSFDEILINDCNAELITTYQIIKTKCKSLIKQLEKLQNVFIPKNDNGRKKYYKIKRDAFNELKINGKNSDNLEKAALFIFLNRTCFNGLYRVNASSLFNVPMGSYTNPLICNKENLQAVSSLLKNVAISCGNYQQCLSFINDKTFVYIDPPYRPLTASSNFTSYTEGRFDDKEQIKLGKFVDKINKKGAKVLISNSDPKNSDPNDLFFDTIYKTYTIERITAKRVINSNAENRGDISELLIRNYER